MKYRLLLVPLLVCVLRGVSASAEVEKEDAQIANAVMAKTPEEERATFTGPKGFEVELIAAEDPANGIGRFVPIAFDQKGGLWTTTAFDFVMGSKEFPAAATPRGPRHAQDKVLVYDRDPKSPTGYTSQPRVFADGLTIPLGVLPYQNGCFVQSGADIVFLDDADHDGKSDDRKVILEGSKDPKKSLFAHQFMRAPGGWIVFAQGQAHQDTPDDEKARTAPARIDVTRMVRIRLEGDIYEVLSHGSSNIWGLTVTAEGDTFVQEATDIGYPVAPLPQYVTYAGSIDRQWLSWAPEFPKTAPDFQMGGGLSGLALTDKAGPFPEAWRDVMLVANTGSQRIQGIKMHRTGTHGRLDKPVDFLVSSDPCFCPVAIAIGPDGCLYIVDRYDAGAWERNETYSRIWRVKPTEAKLFEVPDFTKMNADQVIAKLGGPSAVQSHQAWQAFDPRSEDAGLEKKLTAIVRNPKNSTARRIQALWALNTAGRSDDIWIMEFPTLARDPNPAIRRALARMDRDANRYTTIENAQEMRPLANDTDAEVRAAVICTVGHRMEPWDTQSDESHTEGIRRLVKMAKPALPKPATPATDNAGRIKAEDAYERDYERYLIRGHLAPLPNLVAAFLDSKEGKALPVESRLLAALAVEPMDGAVRISKLLAEARRPPNREELLNLAAFPAEPRVAETLRSVFSHPPAVREGLEHLLAWKSEVDARKLAPFLTPVAARLQAESSPESRDLGARLAAFAAGATASAVDSLFDGKSIAGWHGDMSLWRVDDGMITGGSPVEMVGRNQFLSTARSYSNFDLRLKLKINDPEKVTISSGIQIRSVRLPGSPDMSGYLVDCGGTWDGMLYDQTRRDKVVAEPKDAAAVTAASHKGEWNEYRVRAEGARIQTWVNGVPAVDYTETDPIAQDGHIAILVHGGGKALVQVKEATIEELPPTAGAPTWGKVGRPVAKKAL